MPIEDFIRSLSMKTSARNALRGVVKAVQPGQVNAEVTLTIAGDLEITAIITKRQRVADLGLAPGREAVAIIKSSFVILAKGDEPLRISARNRLVGVVSRITRSAR